MEVRGSDTGGLERLLHRHWSMLHFVPGGLIPFAGRGRKLGLGRAMLPHPLRLLVADTALGSNPCQSSRGLALLAPLARTCSEAQGPWWVAVAATMPMCCFYRLQQCPSGSEGSGHSRYIGKRCASLGERKEVFVEIIIITNRQSPVFFFFFFLYFCSTENSGVLTDEYLSTPNFSICSKHPACFLSSLPHQFCIPRPQQSDVSLVRPKVMTPGEPEEKISHIWLWRLKSHCARGGRKILEGCLFAKHLFLLQTQTTQQLHRLRWGENNQRRRNRCGALRNCPSSWVGDAYSIESSDKFRDKL